jgi:RNA polymerase sigma-70 factor (ECF subfamily)
MSTASMSTLSTTTRCAGLCTRAGAAAADHAHRRRLTAVARGLLHDPALAEDAVQEAFLRAFLACNSFDPAAGPSLSAWLAAITRNVAIDMCRARAVRPGLPRVPIDEPAHAPAGPDPIDRALLRMALADALSGISAEHRGVLVRTVLHDRSHADVAAELGVPIGTVKSRVHHALRNLRGRVRHPEET